jgi:hypothetical protein
MSILKGREKVAQSALSVAPATRAKDRPVLLHKIVRRPALQAMVT